MKRTIIGGVIVLILAVVVSPFVKDIYARHQMMQKLAPVMTEQDKLAFQSWSGDAASFARSLAARCEIENGKDSAACNPYRIAAK
ncbi:MAG TPA: hypothetical protein VNV38_11815 [Stellaceae bacterium]|jgi:hypothetical protein|nr:hypothetical protein [Stellaceae bacterium]